MWYLSLFLGQASALLGVMLAGAWTLALVLIVPPKAFGLAAGPRFLLPIEPPLAGVVIALVGLLFARWSDQPVARYSVAGLIINALPLALAIALLVLRGS
jgi:hypothetical protein